MAIRLDLLRRVSDAELMAISERNPGYQFERSAKGELLVGATSTEGGRRSAQLIHQLMAWNDRSGLGLGFDSSTGWSLPDGSVLSPDASWVALPRWMTLPSADRRGFVHLCPDVVFELRSPSNTVAELRAKMRAYQENGAPLGVLIDPDGRSVDLYRPGQQPVRVEGAASVALDPELPGFTPDLRSIFS